MWFSRFHRPRARDWRRWPGIEIPPKERLAGRIVLMTADGLGTMAIARRTGTSKPTVWRWQRRFMDEGVDGLLRDASRPSRIPPLAPELVAPVVDDPRRAVGRGHPLDRPGDGGRVVSQPASGPSESSLVTIHRPWSA